MKKIQLGGHKKGSPVRGYALVDDEDFEWLNKYKWYEFRCATGGPYAASEPSWRKRVFMHRLVNNTPKGKITDHKNGNGLDNRKENLRICTVSQNQYNKVNQKNNTSGFKGVTWNRKLQKWQTRITIKNKDRVCIGYFEDKKDAARAYNEAAKKYFGEFAKLNKIPS